MIYKYVLYFILISLKRHTINKIKLSTSNITLYNIDIISPDFTFIFARIHATADRTMKSLWEFWGILQNSFDAQHIRTMFVVQYLRFQVLQCSSFTPDLKIRQTFIFIYLLNFNKDVLTLPKAMKNSWSVV